MSAYITLIAGFVLLIKGADILVDGAASLARKFNISSLVIGLTLVAFGTSAPELFVNISANIRGSSGIAIGNVLGSNTANILLVLGISAIIYPLSVKKESARKELLLGLLAVITLGILSNDRLLFKSGMPYISRIDGSILLLLFALFMYYSFFVIGKRPAVKPPGRVKARGPWASALLILLGLIGLGAGSVWAVNGAVEIAGRLGVSEAVVGLTIVAIGTSLPELATSAVAAFKKNPDMAVGNIIGSNILNIFLVLGASSLIKPIPFSEKNNIDISVVILANLLLLMAMFTGRRYRIDRWEGALFLTVYAGYIALLFISK